jgi:hypothetical protein
MSCFFNPNYQYFIEDIKELFIFLDYILFLELITNINFCFFIKYIAFKLKLVWSFVRFLCVL